MVWEGRMRLVANVWTGERKRFVLVSVLGVSSWRERNDR